MKRIVKLSALLMTLVVIVSMFTSSIVASTDSCSHSSIKVQVGDYTSVLRTSIDSNQHHVIRKYNAVCLECGAKVEVTEEFDEVHTFTKYDLISSKHVGSKHIYVYSTRCACGRFGDNETFTIACSGPPCPVL